ncbi:MAG: hypothetical protein CMF31_07485 [Kordiimonas sp.]|nr:hypothetical protein [Kordiimonas sp.]|tara:strand:+ start:1318 stop:1572 length:255 start_codon:yes stop_codon:yes gene_type:complete
MQTALIVMMIWLSISILLGFSISICMGRLSGGREERVKLSNNVTDSATMSHIGTPVFGTASRLARQQRAVVSDKMLGQLRQAGM